MTVGWSRTWPSTLVRWHVETSPDVRSSVAIRGKADVTRTFHLVAIDPQRTFSRCLLSSGNVSSCQQNLVVSQLQDWRVRHMGKLAVVATIKTVAGQAR
jgi:hypothetical protein